MRGGPVVSARRPGAAINPIHVMISFSQRERSIYRLTVVGSLVNLLLVAAKLVAGIAGHSAAMVADAVHSISDFATDLVVIVFVRISSSPRDRAHRYGHGKYETLATLVIGVSLLLVGLGLIYGAVRRIVAVIGGERLESPGLAALAVALLSVVAKEWLFRYTIRRGRTLDSQAVVANAWHHRSDALSSVGTAVGVGGAYLLGNRWAVLDPIAAVVVGFFIVGSSFRLITGSVYELVDGALPAEVEREILDLASSVPGVIGPHGLCTRRVGSGYAIEMHILVDGGMNIREAHAVASRVEEALLERFGPATHVNVHVEPADER